MKNNAKIEIKSTQHLAELKTIQWQKKRQRLLTKSMHLCSECKYNKSLEVHHLYYVNGHKLWEYPDKALVVLCRKCHQIWHDTHEIEYRDSIWSKNKPYEAPLKGIKYGKQTKQKVNRPAVISDKQKAKLRIRDKIKRKLLKINIPNNWLKVFEDTKDLTIDELKEFLFKSN
jgi:hypothetical protein